MFDELERLRSEKELFILLQHYQRVGVADRQAWQDRVVELESVEPRQLVKLHGELLAYGWLEQNTGLTSPPLSSPKLAGNKGGSGAAANCYRITPAGIRALKQARTQEMQHA